MDNLFFIAFAVAPAILAFLFSWQWLLVYGVYVLILGMI